MTKTITATTNLSSPRQAVEQLYCQLSQKNISFVMFFCSASYELLPLGRAFEDSFGAVSVIGCTTAGEINQRGYDQHSIVAIGFCDNYFSISACLVASLNQFDLVVAQAAIEKLTLGCQANSVAELQNNTFMMTLLDGLSSQEERFLSILNSVAGGIPHFGGSAGDDISLTKTHVYYQGAFHQQAAVVVMVNTNLPFEVFSVNHLDTPSEKLVVTCADPQSRTVYELNGEPAAVEYARLHNLELSQLSPQVFALNPVAVKVGTNYFFRSIQKVNLDDNSLSFYCAVDTGIVLTVVGLGDIFSKLSAHIGSVIERYGSPELILGCDCILRRLEIEQTQLQSRASVLFSQFNIIGFNTYGEHINGIHLNQTFTGVFIAGNIDEL